MNADAKPGFWTRLQGGRVRFQWNEPWVFRKRKLKAELRRMHPWFVRSVGVLFPVLIFLVMLIGDWIAGEPLRWATSLLSAAGVPSACILAFWISDRIGSGVWLRDDRAWGEGSLVSRSWRDLESFELADGGEFSVLVFNIKGRRQPTLIGVPPTVPLTELAAFLESRGVRRLAEEAQLPPQLQRAAG